MKAVQVIWHVLKGAFAGIHVPSETFAERMPCAKPFYIVPGAHVHIAMLEGLISTAFLNLIVKNRPRFVLEYQMMAYNAKPIMIAMIILLVRKALGSASILVLEFIATKLKSVWSTGITPSVFVNLVLL
jgi:hypothetical protein